MLVFLYNKMFCYFFGGYTLGYPFIESVNIIFCQQFKNVLIMLLDKITNGIFGCIL